MPAARPHQKTLVHLRDSATVDFGPAGATLTNSGVIVANDEFTFASGDTLGLTSVSLSGKRCFVSFWVYRPDSGQTLLMSDTAATSRFAFVWRSGSGQVAFSNATAHEVWINAVSIGAAPSQSTMHSNTPVGEWVHVAADITFNTSAWDNVQLGAYPFSSSFNFDGSIADFRICEYTPTYGEVFTLWNEGRGYDLPERRQLPDTRLHLLDGLTDISEQGTETTNHGVGYTNNAYSLADGSYLDVGTPLKDAAEDDLFVAVLFRSNDQTRTQPLYMETVNAASSQGGVVLWVNSNGFVQAFVSPDGSGWDNLTGTIDVVDGDWHLLTLRKSGSSFEIRLDYDREVLTGTTDSAFTIWPSVVRGWIGSDPRVDSNTWATADIASVIVRSEAGTVADVESIYRDTIPKLRLSEVLRIDPALYSGSGDLIDQTGGGHAGTMSNGTAVVDGVLSFPGASSQDIRIDGGSFATGQDLTIAAWVKPSQDWRSVNNVGVWDTFPNQPDAFRVYTSGGYLSFELGAEHPFSARYLIPEDWTGQWKHLAVTHVYGASDIYLYVDGLLAHTGTLTSRFNHRSDRVYFGRLNNNYVFAGEMDKMLVAYEAYTADQIAFLAASQEFADPFYEPPLVGSPVTGFSGILSARNTCKPRLITGIRA